MLFKVKTKAFRDTSFNQLLRNFQTNDAVDSNLRTLLGTEPHFVTKLYTPYKRVWYKESNLFFYKQMCPPSWNYFQNLVKYGFT